MKKILSIILTIVAIFALTACQKADASIFNGSYWLSNPSDFGISSISETNVYAVTFTQSDENAKIKINLSDSSSYTTVLTNTTYDGKECYLLETELKMLGSIDNDGEITAIDDSISAKCYFYGLDEGLTPLYSERTVNAHSIVHSDSENYNVNKYNYTVKSTYSGTSCSADLDVTEKPESDESFVSSTFEYTGLTYGKYVDNELLLFAPRAMALNSATSKTFTTVDAVAKSKREMIISSVADQPTKNIELSNYLRNKEKIPSVLCYGIKIAINAKYSGSPITAYYANTATKSERASMIEAKTEAAYGLGYYTYTITKATTNA